jgi:hypothetical protein
MKGIRLNREMREWKQNEMARKKRKEKKKKLWAGTTKGRRDESSSVPRTAPVQK